MKIDYLSIFSVAVTTVFLGSLIAISILGASFSTHLFFGFQIDFVFIWIFAWVVSGLMFLGLSRNINVALGAAPFKFNTSISDKEIQSMPVLPLGAVGDETMDDASIEVEDVNAS